MVTQSSYQVQKSEDHAQLYRIIEELPPARRAEVYDFALFLRQRDLEQAEYTIPDGEALALREEFAAEDLALAEAGIPDCLARLRQEDVV